MCEDQGTKTRLLREVLVVDLCFGDMNDRVFGAVTHVMVMAIVISIILLFLGIAILLLFHICITGRALGRGLGISGMANRGSFGSSNLSREDVEKLPCFDFQPKERGSSPVDCAVCLENFKVGDKCRLLPFCRHSFHAECVDSWLLRTPICPICRASAGSWNGNGGGSIFSSEESSHLGGVVNVVELIRESQTTENGELCDELGDIQAVERANLGGGVVNQSIGSQTREIGHLSDVGNELKESHTVESTNL